MLGREVFHPICLLQYRRPPSPVALFSLLQLWEGERVRGFWVLGEQGRRKGVKEEVKEASGDGVSASEIVTEPNEFPPLPILFPFIFILCCY